MDSPSKRSHNVSSSSNSNNYNNNDRLYNNRENETPGSPEKKLRSSIESLNSSVELDVGK
jgi:hypothetical protein